jgi:predicted metalloprotease with PDZ domain
MRKRDSYVGWMALVSHEFFHAWNVRRLRPKELMQYNYGTEQYFGELWIAEGITSYFDDLFVVRSQLCSRDEYLGLLSKNLTAVQSNPGRLMQSLFDSSWDTWIKFYRPDENANNSRVNYYSKGALVGLLLDVEIQRSTDGKKNLTDVMRRLWTEHRVTGYTNDDFKRLASEEAGTDLSDWFQSKLDRPDDLDFALFLEWYGLRFKGENGNAKPAAANPPVANATIDPKAPATGPATASPEAEKPKKEVWIGWETGAQDGRLLVKRLPRGSPADLAGINVDDEVIALDGFRLSADVLNERLSYYQPGEQLPILVARRGRLVELRLELGTKPTPSWQLEVLPDATPEQKSRLAKWLNLPPEPPSAAAQTTTAESPKSPVDGAPPKP